MTSSKPRFQRAPNGPVIVEGLSQMRDSNGLVACETKMAQCRCGGSKNKPFCDGTHWGVKFDETAK